MYMIFIEKSYKTVLKYFRSTSKMELSLCRKKKVSQKYQLLFSIKSIGFKSASVQTVYVTKKDACTCY